MARFVSGRSSTVGRRGESENQKVDEHDPIHDVADLPGS